MTNDIKDIERLKGKRFLFVDDRKSAISYYQKELGVTGQDITSKRANSLEDALKMLKNAEGNEQLFDIVLIDLHIPPIPDELASYAKQLRYDWTKLNEGQTLGLWLEENHPNLPYAYLTVVPDVMDRSLDSQTNIQLIDKDKVLPDQIAEKLCMVLDQWKMRK